MVTVYQKIIVIRKGTDVCVAKRALDQISINTDIAKLQESRAQRLLCAFYCITRGQCSRNIHNIFKQFARFNWIFKIAIRYANNVAYI